MAHSSPCPADRAIRRRVLLPLWAGVAAGLLLAGCGGSGSVPSATSSPGPSEASPSGTPESAVDQWIAYQWYTGTDHDGVYLVKPDGTQSQPLSADPAPWRGHHDWSPDGDRLVYAWLETPDSAEQDLVTSRADGTDERPLVSCPPPDCWAVDYPAWSPDGTSVLFTQYETLKKDPALYERTSLRVVDVQTGKVDTLLTSPPATAYTLARWSPDGRSVVFTVENPLVGKGAKGASWDVPTEAMGLVVVDLDDPSLALRPLTEPDMFASYADWRSDGELIVFDTYTPSVMFGAGNPTIYTVDPKGGEPTAITDAATADGAAAAEPSWTPDGSRIVFTVVRPGLGNKSIATMAPDGSDVQVLDILGRSGRLQPSP